jgi:hypothetical protein
VRWQSRLRQARPATGEIDRVSALAAAVAFTARTRLPDRLLIHHSPVDARLGRVAALVGTGECRPPSNLTGSDA